MPRYDAGENAKGWKHFIFAFHNSSKGFRVAWRETAFRHECALLLPLTVLALWLPFSIYQQGILIASHLFVLIVELLNTAIETVVDRIGLEIHSLSAAAKDMGSAAVFLSLCLTGVLWLSSLLSL